MEFTRKGKGGKAALAGIMAACLMAPAALTGCGAQVGAGSQSQGSPAASQQAVSAEDQCRSTVAEMLDWLKQGDEEGIEAVCSKVGMSPDSMFADKDEEAGKALLLAWFDGFDYEIGEVAVNDDGESADVSVNVKCKPVELARTAGESAAWDAGQEIFETGYNGDSYGAEKSAAMDAIGKIEPKNVETSLRLEKSDDGWHIAEKSSNSFILEVAGIHDEDVSAAMKALTEKMDADSKAHGF